MISFKEYILLENEGVEYENRVRKLISKISKKYPNIKILKDSGKGAFSAHDVDLNLQVGKQNFNYL